MCEILFDTVSHPDIWKRSIFILVSQVFVCLGNSYLRKAYLGAKYVHCITSETSSLTQLYLLYFTIGCLLDL